MKKITIISLLLLMLTACTNEAAKKYANPIQNMDGISQRSTSIETNTVPE